MDDLLKVCEEGERLSREAMTLPWYCHYSEDTDEIGSGPCGLSISLDEEDPCDAFVFSYNFSASGGIDDKHNATFDYIAHACNHFPALAAAYRRQCEELATLREACKKAYSLIGVQPFNTIGREVSDELNAALAATEGK